MKNANTFFGARQRPPSLHDDACGTLRVSAPLSNDEIYDVVASLCEVGAVPSDARFVASARDALASFGDRGGAMSGRTWVSPPTGRHTTGAAPSGSRSQRGDSGWEDSSSPDATSRRRAQLTAILEKLPPLDAPSSVTPSVSGATDRSPPRSEAGSRRSQPTLATSSQLPRVGQFLRDGFHSLTHSVRLHRALTAWASSSSAAGDDIGPTQRHDRSGGDDLASFSRVLASMPAEALLAAPYLVPASDSVFGGVLQFLNGCDAGGVGDCVDDGASRPPPTHLTEMLLLDTAVVFVIPVPGWLAAFGDDGATSSPEALSRSADDRGADGGIVSASIPPVVLTELNHVRQRLLDIRQRGAAAAEGGSWLPRAERLFRFHELFAAWERRSFVVRVCPFRYVGTMTPMPRYRWGAGVPEGQRPLDGPERVMCESNLISKWRILLRKVAASTRDRLLSRKGLLMSMTAVVSPSGGGREGAADQRQPHHRGVGAALFEDLDGEVAVWLPEHFSMERAALRSDAHLGLWHNSAGGGTIGSIYDSTRGDEDVQRSVLALHALYYSQGLTSGASESNSAVQLEPFVAHALQRELTRSGRLWASQAVDSLVRYTEETMALHSTTAVVTTLSPAVARIRTHATGESNRHSGGPWGHGAAESASGVSVPDAQTLGAAAVGDYADDEEGLSSVVDHVLAAVCAHDFAIVEEEPPSALDVAVGGLDEAPIYLRERRLEHVVVFITTHLFVALGRFLDASHTGSEDAYRARIHKSVMRYYFTGTGYTSTVRTRVAAALADDSDDEDGLAPAFMSDQRSDGAPSSKNSRRRDTVADDEAGAQTKESAPLLIPLCDIAHMTVEALTPLSDGNGPQSAHVPRVVVTVFRLSDVEEPNVGNGMSLSAPLTPGDAVYRFLVTGASSFDDAERLRDAWLLYQARRVGNRATDLVHLRLLHRCFCAAVNGGAASGETQPRSIDSTSDSAFAVNPRRDAVISMSRWQTSLAPLVAAPTLRHRLFLAACRQLRQLAAGGGRFLSVLRSHGRTRAPGGRGGGGGQATSTLRLELKADAQSLSFGGFLALADTWLSGTRRRRFDFFADVLCATNEGFTGLYQRDLMDVVRSLSAAVELMPLWQCLPSHEAQYVPRAELFAMLERGATSLHAGEAGLGRSPSPDRRDGSPSSKRRLASSAAFVQRLAGLGVLRPYQACSFAGQGGSLLSSPAEECPLMLGHPLFGPSLTIATAVNLVCGLELAAGRAAAAVVKAPIRRADAPPRGGADGQSASSAERLPWLPPGDGALPQKTHLAIERKYQHQRVVSLKSGHVLQDTFEKELRLESLFSRPGEPAVMELCPEVFADVRQLLSDRVAADTRAMTFGHDNDGPSAPTSFPPATSLSAIMRSLGVAQMAAAIAGGAFGGLQGLPLPLTNVGLSTAARSSSASLGPPRCAADLLQPRSRLFAPCCDDQSVLVQLFEPGDFQVLLRSLPKYHAHVGAAPTSLLPRVIGLYVLSTYTSSSSPSAAGGESSPSRATGNGRSPSRGSGSQPSQPVPSLLFFGLMHHPMPFAIHRPLRQTGPFGAAVPSPFSPLAAVYVCGVATPPGPPSAAAAAMPRINGPLGELLAIGMSSARLRLVVKDHARRELLRQIKADVELLVKAGLLHYSLVVGIFPLLRSVDGGAGGGGPNWAPGDDDAEDDLRQQPLQGRGGVNGAAAVPLGRMTANPLSTAGGGGIRQRHVASYNMDYYRSNADVRSPETDLDEAQELVAHLTISRDLRERYNGSPWTAGRRRAAAAETNGAPSPPRGAQMMGGVTGKLQANNTRIVSAENGIDLSPTWKCAMCGTLNTRGVQQVRDAALAVLDGGGGGDTTRCGVSKPCRVCFGLVEEVALGDVSRDAGMTSAGGSDRKKVYRTPRLLPFGWTPPPAVQPTDDDGSRNGGDRDQRTESRHSGQPFNPLKALHQSKAPLPTPLRQSGGSFASQAPQRYADPFQRIASSAAIDERRGDWTRQAASLEEGGDADAVHRRPGAHEYSMPTWQAGGDNDDRLRLFGEQQRILSPPPPAAAARGGKDGILRRQDTVLPVNDLITPGNTCVECCIEGVTRKFLDDQRFGAAGRGRRRLAASYAIVDDPRGDRAVDDDTYRYELLPFRAVVTFVDVFSAMPSVVGGPTSPTKDDARAYAVSFMVRVKELLGDDFI